MIVLYALFVIGSVVIFPVLASVALADLLNPLVYQFEKRGLSRTLSSIIAIMGVSLAVAGFFSYVLPDLWSQSSRAGQTIIENFTPENAAHQRALLRRFSPALERVAGDKIEQFLSDPVGFYDENVAEPTAATIDEEGNIKPTERAERLFFRFLLSSLDLLLSLSLFFTYFSISRDGVICSRN